MALHGDIRVNGQLLGTWSAIRMTQLAHPDAEHYYDCDVQWAFDLRKAGSRYTFQIAHRYSDGATALAAKVLAEAASTAPKPPPPPRYHPLPDPVIRQKES